MVESYAEDDTGVREGGDITAEHMVLPEDEGEPSQIARFFEGSTVLVTGATGYLGRMFVEKLLRACQLRRLYVLIRPKKGKEVGKRFEELFDGPSMEPLKRLKPNFSQKVELIAGDLQVEGLGLAPEDRERLINEVDCVIHCGATVKFDEAIRVATNINVRSVRDLLHMARQMKGLRAFLYVSTAFANCTRTTIEEKFYDPPITGDKLIKLTELLEDDKLNAITPIIMGEWPNTYVFTKAVAEDICRTEGKGLPVAVFRPSVVIASVKEPVAGWIDNIYGATGVLLAAAVGLLRTFRGRVENLAEMVPADYVVNSAIAAMWDTASVKCLQEDKETNKEEKVDREIPVYNYVSSPDAPITWKRFMALAEKHAPEVPSPLLVWHYFFAIHPSKLGHMLACFFYHTVPAYIVDFICICIGKKPMLVKGYQKIEKFTNVISYFATRQWSFGNSNTWSSWTRMNKNDRRLFNFSMKNFDWDSYFHSYVRGARIYLLRDPMETLPEGRRKYYKLMVAHYALMTFLVFLLYKLLIFLYNIFV